MLEGVWRDFLTIMRQEAGSQVVETWLKAVSLYYWDAQQKIVYLKVPNAFVKEWVKNNYASLLQTHLCRLLNVESLRIVFIDGKSDFVPARPVATTSLPVQRSRGAAVRCKEQSVNGHHVFETFVVGPHNALAYEAVQAIIKNPGVVYNPLLLCGGSGVGKTHLLHALMHEFREHHQNSFVLYQTADRFMDEFIRAIRTDRAHRFQARYRHADLFILDDFQLIANKEQTQEAFFHIFNCLYELRRQIVVSCDAYPKNLPGIANRLRSRLDSALIADMQMPAFEPRLAIVKNKARALDVSLDESVARLLATHQTESVRELEGLLIRTVALASLTKQEITTELAKEVLDRRISRRRTRIIAPERIIKQVCVHFRYSLQDLRSTKRGREISLVRQVAMYLLKRLTGKPLRDIGNFLYRKDHSTVIHAINKVERMMETDTFFAADIQNLMQTLGE